MVLSTATSPVRSRALIIIALAVTSRIANTTAMPIVPISRLDVAPHGGEAGVERLLGPGLGRGAGVAELVVDRLGHAAPRCSASSISMMYQPAMPGRPILSSRYS